jgi:hypothetical protein
MKNLKFIILTVLAIISSLVSAQEVDSIKTASQITIFYPLSSNGPQAKNISNNLSFNVLYGVNGGLDGFELGAIANVIKGEVKGCQIAGITNVVQGSALGVQIGGIANVVGDSLIGIQIAGISNVVPTHTIGAQISGISNFTKNEVVGAQISGVSNIASKSIQGTQITGISNIVNGKIEGAQISGIHNLVTEDATGAQVSGFYNQTLGTMRGAQVGLVNSAHVLHGFQLGLINVADSSTGVSVGLLNLVKNGYHAIEFSANEVMYANMTIKLGTNQFYNIYQAGFQPESDNLFGFGVGFGSKIRLANWLSFSGDLTFNHINELEKFEWKVNLLTKADLTFDLNLNKHIALVVGPTFNAHVSELGYENTGKFTTNIAVDPFYTDTYEGYQLQLWVGAKGGLRISF